MSTSIPKQNGSGSRNGMATGSSNGSGNGSNGIATGNGSANGSAPPSKSGGLACLNCRPKKIKCQREGESCKRCLRLKLTCLVPDGDERRRYVDIFCLVVFAMERERMERFHLSEISSFRAI